MTSEHLLDAMGLLDDDLIQQAEDYRPGARSSGRRAWMSLAACFALVLILGYGLTHLRMGGSSSQPGAANGGAQNAPTSSAPAAGAPTSGEPAPADGEQDVPAGEGENSCPEAPASPDIQGGLPNGLPAGSFRPAIMVDGTLYYSTGTPIPGEVDESAIRQVTAYINTLPQMDGQTNFSEDLSARYAVTDLGVVVLIEDEWILFEPASSEDP